MVDGFAPEVFAECDCYLCRQHREAVEAAKARGARISALEVAVEALQGTCIAGGIGGAEARLDALEGALRSLAWRLKAIEDRPT